MTAAQLRAAYRLQLGPRFGFAQARELVPYLRELGVSHLYLSPSLQAAQGSTHGYDVVDPTRVSEDLGGEDALRALARAGLRVILDIVPNHMGIGDENRWWADPRTRERWFDLDPGGGYRRFFDIDSMAAIRQERDEVFVTSHAKVLELVREGLVDGLRIDHPDGLADPAGYLRRLAACGAQRVWVEKILAPGERVRDWPICGTVGYEFLNDVCALFVDPAGEAPLTQLHAAITGDSRTFAEVALEAQLEQARGPFARELARLERAGPFTTATLVDALARLPVYRTYVDPQARAVAEDDRSAIARSGMDARLARALLLDDGDPNVELVTRFQQTSPAIAAKGVEDTAFYRFLRLIALNEVGGDPGRFSVGVEDLHRANAERAERFPHALLTTQTHDTKRSGDTRARIAALSAMAEEWSELAPRWIALGERLGGAPPAIQYMLLQTLVGVWPISSERLDGYLVKAMREAKQETSWAQPDEAFERVVLDFSHRLCASSEFLEAFEPFARRIALAGERSALGQLLIKLTAPGFPDIFQGDELWRLSLVDPDNRRPVDWQVRREALAALRSGSAPTRETSKLALIAATLALRAEHADCFEGSYTPIAAGAGICAYLRGERILCVVAVRPQGEEELLEAPGGRWRERLSGRELDLTHGTPVASIVNGAGLALLERVT
jgi:(1->4)-alpha-D-glucan 1-alpha-D-glucosylmutase